MPEHHDAHLTLVTLGVGNLERSIAFYETMGFRRKSRAAEGVGVLSGRRLRDRGVAVGRTGKGREFRIRGHGARLPRRRARMEL